MPIEIEILDNQYGVKKVFLSVEEKILELTVKTDSDPTGINLAKSLLSQKITAVDEGNYEPNSFYVKLPKSNCIRMKGELENIIDFLKNTRTVSVEIIQELEKQTRPISFQGQQPTRSDFFNSKSKASPSLSSDEADVEEEVRELIASFKPEDKAKVLTLLKLSEKLDPERRRALQESLSAQIASNRSSNTPTRS